jgi:hypothetical protein
MAATWDDFERLTAFRRPSDWRDRPDGPDELDLPAADMSAIGQALSRADLLLAAGACPVCGRTDSVRDPDGLCRNSYHCIAVPRSSDYLMGVSPRTILSKGSL